MFFTQFTALNVKLSEIFAIWHLVRLKIRYNGHKMRIGIFLFDIEKEKSL